MKFKEKTRVFSVRFGKFRGVECWRIAGYAEDNPDRTEYHLRPFETQEEAEKWAKVLRKSMVLDAEGLRDYYGCLYCADARNSLYEAIGHGDHARYCIHKECPYADEIERAGGFENLYKDFCNGNYSFIDFSKAMAFYEEVENGQCSKNTKS